MAHGVRRAWEWDGEGVPLLLGMVIATGVSLGLWLVLSYASWLVLR